MSGRTGGRPPRISRDQIVAAARDVAGRGLTMQAVADALGVSRKALHYYVGDREGLLTLVVLDLFESELAGIELPTDADWRTVLRAYAVAFRDGMVQVGTTTESANLRGVGGAAALALADRVLDALLTAGFGPDDARRGLAMASNIAQSAAHNVVVQHQAQTRAVLASAPPDAYPALRRVLAVAAPDDSQFEFELDTAVAGLERTLAARPAGSG